MVTLKGSHGRIKQTFEEELATLLERYQVPYDERYIWSWNAVRPFQGRNRIDFFRGRCPRLL